jgi:hypothetical protein
MFVDHQCVRLQPVALEVSQLIAASFKVQVQATTMSIVHVIVEDLSKGSLIFGL